MPLKSVEKETLKKMINPIESRKGEKRSKEKAE